MTDGAFEARAAMLIRRPVAEVYEAFVDPAITSKFWFTEGSARLDAGVSVTWSWAMYGAKAEVTVTALEPPRRIAIGWGEGEATTPVEWTFTDRGELGTFVEVANTGLASVDEAIGGTEGFTLVLANAKAWLEHLLELGLVADRFPPE